MSQFLRRAVAITEVPQQPVLPLLSPKLGTVFKSLALRKPMEFLFSTTSVEAGSSPRHQLLLLSSIKLFAVSV
jgi:hypothetical protein